MISAPRHKSKFKFRTFLNFFFKIGFHGVVGTRDDLSIDVAINY